MVLLGVIGEYLGRIYAETKQRPSFLLKESSEADVPVTSVLGREHEALHELEGQPTDGASRRDRLSPTQRRKRARTDGPAGPAPTWVWPLLVVVATAVYTAVPFLVTGWFYQRGDTAAQFAPTWWHLGQMVRDGQWPPWLDPHSWAGGNYAAEALFGIYNPLNVLIWVFVSLGPDLAVLDVPRQGDA